MGYIIRGASFMDYNTRELVLGERFNEMPEYIDVDYGFRVALDEEL